MSLSIVPHSLVSIPLCPERCNKLARTTSLPSSDARYRFFFFSPAFSFYRVRSPVFARKTTTKPPVRTIICSTCLCIKCTYVTCPPDRLLVLHNSGNPWVVPPSPLSLRRQSDQANSFLTLRSRPVAAPFASHFAHPLPLRVVTALPFFFTRIFLDVFVGPICPDRRSRGIGAFRWSFHLSPH